MDNWGWGWNAVSAIGQLLGVAVTFIAILIALFQNKPKIKVRARRDGRYSIDSSTMKPIEHVGDIIVTATNIGLNAVEITMIGYKMPHAAYTTTEYEINKLPKLLKPGESVSLKFDSQSLKRIGIKSYIIFYALDSTGEAHYHDANIIQKVQRFLWWNLGKYFGKYREYIEKYDFKEPK